MYEYALMFETSVEEADCVTLWLSRRVKTVKRGVIAQVFAT